MRINSSQCAAGIFCIFLVIRSCFTSFTAKRVILRPLHAAETDKTFNVGPRDTNIYSKLDLQTQGQLRYGNFPENGSFNMANMTLYAPNGMLMVLLEHFDHLTSTIDCQGDDGTMSLTFKSNQAYQYALKAWGYINDNADDKFLLIANHQGCGPDEERQAYIITSIKEDTVSLTTYLAAEPAPWSDIGGSYDLDFQHVVTHPHSLQRRNWLTGNFDETKTADFDSSLGHRDEVDTIWHDDVRLILDCINCFVDGSFHVIGHIKTHHWELEEATLSASPKNFNATLELQAAVSNTEKLEELSGKKELFSMPVPDLGFEIPHLCKLGVTLAYQIGFSTKLLGSATVFFGATSSLPDDAVITVDIKEQKISSHKGFENTAFLPIYDVTALSSTVKFAAFTQADIAFGLEIEGIDKSDIELNLKLPQLASTINAGYKEGGFCSQEDGAVETGAKITTALSIELWLEIYQQFEEERNNLFSHRFFNLTDTLDERCKPISIDNFMEGPLQSVPELLPIPTELIPPA